MQGMRDLLRSTLARSLRTLPEEDRLATALPVVCGAALASHCELIGFDERRTLHLRIDGPEWLRSFRSMQEVLTHDLARISGVALDKIHFVEAQRTRSANAVPGLAASTPANTAAQRRPETTSTAPSSNRRVGFSSYSPKSERSR